MKDNFVTIKSFSSEAEAEIFNKKLNASGIEAVIEKDDCSSTDPTKNLTFGVHVKVRNSDYEKACSMMDEDDIEKNAHETTSTRSGMPFLIVMFLFLGTGLFLTGHTYYQSLIKYGVIFVAIGVVLWLSYRFKRKRINTT